MEHIHVYDEAGLFAPEFMWCECGEMLHVTEIDDEGRALVPVTQNY